MKWYLAGPICGVKDGSDRRWREVAKQSLDYIDPFEEEERVKPLGNVVPKQRLRELRESGQFAEMRRVMQTILKMDRDAVSRSDGVLAYAPKASWGTARECVIAHLQGKPVVMWRGDSEEPLNNSQVGLSTALCRSLERAVQICRGIESGMDS